MFVLGRLLRLADGTAPSANGITSQQSSYQHQQYGRLGRHNCKYRPNEVHDIWVSGCARGPDMDHRLIVTVEENFLSRPQMSPQWQERRWGRALSIG